MRIGGRWLNTGQGATAATTDPTTPEAVTYVAKGITADVDAAMRAAHLASEEGPWRLTDWRHE